ncbi:MAG: 6-bladed beta-propeller [Tannerella sp.]|jgi:hypothetical protein|nr:6-bladed beta-propeller [Tannerella sp.]
MKRTVYLLVTIILITYGYQAYKAVSEHLNDRIKIKMKGVLSDITDKVASIPLETPDSSEVTNVKRVLKDEDNIFLISNNRLLHYDISGKFKNHIARDVAENDEYIRSYTLNVEQRQVIVIDSQRNILTYSYNGNFISKKTLSHQWQKISALEFYNGYLWAAAETYVKSNDSENSYKIVNKLFKIDYQMNIVSETVLKTVDVGRKQMLNFGYATEILSGEDGLYAYSSPYNMKYLLEDTLHILQQKKIPVLHIGEIFGSGCIYNVRRGGRFFISNNGFTFCYDDRNHTAYQLNKGFKDNFFDTGFVSDLQPVDVYCNTYCYMNTAENATNLYIFTLKA